MIYLKNNLNNITNNKEDYNGSFIYIRNIGTEKLPKKINSELKSCVKSECGSIFNYKINSVIQDGFCKNEYLLNNNIGKENEYLGNKMNDRTQVIDKNSGNLIQLNIKPHICQNNNANCLNKNTQLNNSFYNNIGRTKDSKIKISTQNDFAKNKINFPIKHFNSIKYNRDMDEKKNYIMRKYSELYTGNNKKELGQNYFIFNDKYTYKLKNNDKILSNGNENASIKFPKFLSLNTKQTMKDHSKVITSNNFDKVDYKIQNHNVSDLKNKHNFYRNYSLSFVENNKYKKSFKNIDNKCNMLHNYVRKNSSLNNIIQENGPVKQNIKANRTVINNNTGNNNINGDNRKLIQLKSINSYDRMTENKFVNLKKNSEDINNFHYVNKNPNNMNDKKIVETCSSKLFPLNQSFQATNSKSTCSNIFKKNSLKLCNHIGEINEKKNKIFLIPTSKNASYVNENERHEQINSFIRLRSEACNENVYFKNNEQNIKYCEIETKTKFEGEIKSNYENEKDRCQNVIKENEKNKSILCGIEKTIMHPKTCEISTELDKSKLEFIRNKLTDIETENKKMSYNSLRDISQTNYAYSKDNYSIENNHEKNHISISSAINNMDNVHKDISSMENNLESATVNKLKKKKKKKTMIDKENLIFENELHENHKIEILKILRKVKKAKNSKFNMDQFISQKYGYEKIINYIETNNKEDINYSKSDELNISKKETKKANQNLSKVKKRENSNDCKNRMGSYNLNEKMIYGENEYKNKENNNKSIKNMKKNITTRIKNNNTIESNFKKDSELTLEFINKVKSCLHKIDLSFNELIHLNKIKYVFWYLYIKSRFLQKLSVTEFCKILKDKINEKMNQNYFMEYVTLESFQNFSKSNFENFDNKMKILENLFYLLKSYPLDYDENKGCFYILNPQKNKMFKNSKYNIIKNKINHLKLTKEVTENFKNNFFLLDKIFIPKDAFFFVKDSEDIGLRDKSNKIIYIHQALVNDLKEDINDKSIFENFYSSYPPFKSDYFRYIQKKRIQNKIRKIKEYILYYYEFDSVVDFFEILLEFNQEYKNLQKSNDSVLAFNTTKKIYEKYNDLKKKKINNYNLQNTNNNNYKSIIKNKFENNAKLNDIKLPQKDGIYSNLNLTGVQRIYENNKNENSPQFKLKKCFSSDMIRSYGVNTLLKLKEDKENDLCEENGSESLNESMCHEDRKGNEICSIKNNSTKNFNENENKIDESSLIYRTFFNMSDTHKKVKEVNFEIFKIFIENLGKIKGFPNFTAIEECFLGICFCDPDIPKHIFSQKKILPKKMNFNGFMTCMRYVPYITPDYPIPTCYFSSLYNNSDIFNSRNDFINVLKYKGKDNMMIELRNKIVLDIIKLFVLISWNFGAETGMFSKFADIPSGKIVDMVDSSYYINYKYYLKKNKRNTNVNENLILSSSVSDYLSSSESSIENETEKHSTVRREGERKYNNTSKIMSEKIYDESSNTYKNDEVLSTNSKHYYQYNNIHDNNETKQNDSFEQFFLKKKKKMSYKFIPKWHVCHDIFLSRLVSYDEIQISLPEIFPLFMIQTALIYIIHISCCLLNDEEWKHYFQSPFALYNKLTPEEVAIRYIKLKGHKFYKLKGITLNKNIDIHHVFMNIPENMQCHEIYKLAINGESTSTGYLAEPFDIYHLMFVSKVFWYIFRYADNFLILRSTLLQKKNQ